MMRLTWLIKQIADWITGGQGFPCLFHLVTGLYCPGCGGTRAVRLMLQGRWLLSFQYHPFVLYALFAAAAEGLILLWTMARKRGSRSRAGTEPEKGCRWNDYRNGMLRRYPRWVLAGAGIVLVNWIVKNICLAAGIDLLPPL